MKAIKYFNDFLKESIVKIQNPDKSRAEFLVNESKRDYSFLEDLLNKVELKDNNANDFIKLCHDILMEILRAKMLIDGYNASGYRAHEAEISYLRNLGFSENDVQFADQIRYFRNGMLYYGTILDKEYADKVIKFLKRVYPKLLNLSNKNN